MILHGQSVRTVPVLSYETGQNLSCIQVSILVKELKLDLIQNNYTRLLGGGGKRWERILVNIFKEKIELFLEKDYALELILLN